MGLIRKYFWLGAGAVLALGAIFAFLGVYDTNNLPFHQRFVFWTTTMLVGTGAAALFGPWIFNRALRDQNIMVRLAAIAAINSVPVTLVLAGFYTEVAFQWPFGVWAMQFLRVFAISMIVVGGGYMAARALGLIGAAQEQEQAAASPVPKFLERLPATYRGAELYAVSSEDHYLRVHTDRGEELILMRLSDAMRELDGADGLQTHRSWWVAREGVASVSRDNGKQTLELKSGASVPVSRSFAKAVKDAGFSV